MKEKIKYTREEIQAYARDNFALIPLAKEWNDMFQELLHSPETRSHCHQDISEK